MKSSEYINQERRLYSVYTLTSRAIPHAADGLKAAARRVLWTARNGNKFKSATLAGATMPIHPHAEASGTINTLAGPYGNNIPLLTGYGAFGTLLQPTAYGAARYTAVAISSFTKDVVFRDIDIIPMMDNYDGTLQEPKHFLPLIPVALLNPQEGIAVGFACSILPRTLDDIIDSQIQHLQNKKQKTVYPAFTPTNNYCNEQVVDKNGNIRSVFIGSFEKINATKIKITNLPYGMVHTKFISKLNNLIDNGTILDWVDNSSNTYDIVITFKKGILRGMSNDEIIKLVGLINQASENLNVVDFDGNRINTTTFSELVQLFTDWRVQWYKARYQRLHSLLEIDVRRYKDVMLAIKKNMSGLAIKIGSRQELKEVLKQIGVVHIDYIADLPIYRFTEDERQKTERKLAEATKLLNEYTQLIKSDSKRKDVYVAELKQIKSKYKKGDYTK